MQKPSSSAALHSTNGNKASKVIFTAFFALANIGRVVAPLDPVSMALQMGTGKHLLPTPVVQAIKMVLPMPQATMTVAKNVAGCGTLGAALESPDANFRTDGTSPSGAMGPKVCRTKQSCLECVWFSDGASCSPGCLSVGFSRKVLPSTNITQASQCCRPTASVKVNKGSNGSN